MPDTPRPLTAYSLRALQQIARTVTHLASPVEVAGSLLRLQQLRLQLSPAHTIGEPHSHSCYEGILVIDGEIEYALCEPSGLRSGDVCLHLPFLRHGWQTTDRPCLRAVWWFQCTPPCYPAQTQPLTAACPDLRADLELLAHEVVDAPPGWRTRVPLRVATLLARLVTLHHAQQPSPARRQDEGFLAAIDQFVRDNLGEPLTLAGIATHFGMSERSLVRAYRRMTGRTLWAAVQQLRMEQAATLLAETALPVTAVAARVGMADAAYFCARFRRYYQATPTHYRDRAGTPAPR